MSRTYDQTRGPGGPDEDQQGDKLKHRDCWRLNEYTDGGIRLADPGAEGRMGRVRVMMMVREALRFRLREKTSCRPDGQRQIDSRHAEGDRNKHPSHFVSLRTCCMSATASGLSQSRGPTARPTARPSGASSTVVGRPRTIKLRETS
jgi:hypothetical protein